MEENKNLVGYDPNMAYGFEETKSEDIIVPRIKIVQALSPERKDKYADEGDIINSLTKEAIGDVRFIPVKQYYSNIEWNPDRSSELRMLCRSFDGITGTCQDGVRSCAACKRNTFDNTKTGKEAQPPCTAYLNFLGFFEGDPMPVIVSFAKTNYNEGKKMLSLAKSLRASLWNYGYKFTAKEVTKNGNTWYIIVPKAAGETSPEDRQYAYQLYSTYLNTTVNADYEDTGAVSDAIDDNIAAEI